MQTYTDIILLANPESSQTKDVRQLLHLGKDFVIFMLTSSTSCQNSFPTLT